MEFTVDATIALAEIAGTHHLDRQLITLVYEAACQHREYERAQAICKLHYEADAGNASAIAILERMARECLPIPVYRKNVEEGYRLLSAPREG